MIKFRRGSTKSWRDTKTKLESGQPGYDKDKHKIKVGDGEKLWSDLPYATGLFAEEVLDSESKARDRKKKDAEDTTLITYGTEEPNKNTVGQIYLQQIDEPEVDYVIESGKTDTGWTYQKWKSGIAKCWCNYSFRTSVLEQLELFHRSTTISTSYPFTFSIVPTETATIQSSSGSVLLANSGANTVKNSGKYAIISIAGPLDTTDYYISIQVEGFWK